MKRVIFATLLLSLTPLVSVAATLAERVEALEKRNAELYHTLEGKKAAGLKSEIAEQLSISGLLELEAGYERLKLDGGGQEASSDLALATAQLGLEAEVTEHLSATLILLYEEEDGAVIEVDEALIGYSRDGWVATVGRQYVPFGEFPSHFISSPLTLELGETRETAILVGREHDLFSVSAFVFNGDAEKVDGAGEPEEDHLRDWGVSGKASLAQFLEFGASFLSDFADTDAELLGEYVDRVPGWSAFALIRMGAFEVDCEVLGAVGSFDDADLDSDGDGEGDRPLAWNVELAWGALENVELAARVEGSSEMAGAPELQYGGAVSWGPREHVSLALEVLHGEFDRGFGEGVDSRDRVTAQLAVEF